MDRNPINHCKYRLMHLIAGLFCMFAGFGLPASADAYPDHSPQGCDYFPSHASSIELRG